MDIASFLTGLLPLLAACIVGAVAYRRRRRNTFPLIMNPYTMVVEPQADSLGKLPLVQPMPPTTTSQDVDPVPTAHGPATSGTRSAHGSDLRGSLAAAAPPRDV